MTFFLTNRTIFPIVRRAIANMISHECFGEFITNASTVAEGTRFQIVCKFSSFTNLTFANVGVILSNHKIMKWIIIAIYYF
jgi:hypothetical protein